eukprot:2190035-Amphidinium_carterae.1
MKQNTKNNTPPQTTLCNCSANGCQRTSNARAPPSSLQEKSSLSVLQHYCFNKSSTDARLGHGEIHGERNQVCKPTAIKHARQTRIGNPNL